MSADPLDTVADACDAALRLPSWRGQAIYRDLLETASHDIDLALEKARDVLGDAA